MNQPSSPRDLVNVGFILLKCTKPIESKKAATCSIGETYPCMFINTFFRMQPELLVIDDEDKVKVLKENHFSHFDLTPVEIDADYSTEFARLQEEAHREWGKSVEFLMNYQDEVFSPKDIVYWFDNYRDPNSNIDYDTPMYVISVDDKNRTAVVTSMMQPINDFEGKQFTPLDWGSFAVETVGLYRLRKSYY